MLIETLMAISFLGLLSGIWGNFIISKNVSLLGDMVGHAILPGLCIGYLVSGYDANPIYLMPWAFLSGAASVYLLSLFTKGYKESVDVGMSVILSGFYALGIALLSGMQSQGNLKTPLNKILLGQASALTQDDFLSFAFLLVFSVAFIIIFFKALKSICFDHSFSKIIGFPVYFLNFCIFSLVCINLIFSVRAVGVILACAFLVIPSATAIFLSKRFSTRIILSSFTGMISGVLGVLLSYYFENLPTGPSIVVVSAVFFFLAFLFGPNHGRAYSILRLKRRNKLYKKEDILKAIYLSAEKNNRNFAKKSEILSRTGMRAHELQNRSYKLVSESLISIKEHKFYLTDSGSRLAKKIVRKHRLWELYLVEKLNFKSNEVHENAEDIEHILTPDIVARLEKVLNAPSKDPHGSEIPL